MTTANAHGNIPEIVLRHRLRIAREEAGLSVQGLAERMGVARNTVGNAEAGKGTPRKVVLNAWALATGVDITWLETGNAPTGTNPDGGDGTNGLRIKSPKLFQLSYRGTDDFSNVHDLFPRRAAA